MIVWKYIGLVVGSIDSYLQVGPFVSQAHERLTMVEEAKKQRRGNNEASNAIAIIYIKTQIYYYLKWLSGKHSVRRIDKSKIDELMQ